MTRLTACAISLAVVLAAGVADAQSVRPPDGEGNLPQFDDPNTYPQAEAERPLLYPAGVEVEGYFQTFSGQGSDMGDYLPVTLLARWGDGSIEVFGGMQALAKQPEGADVETLRFVRGGAAYLVGNDVAIRGDLRIIDPTEDTVTTYRMRGTGEFKRVITPVFAVVGISGLELLSVHPDPAPDDSIYDLLVFLRGEGIYQTNEEISIRGRGTMWFPIASGPEERDPTTRLDLSLRVMYTPAPTFDLFGELLIERATSDEDELGVDPTTNVLRFGALVRL